MKCRRVVIALLVISAMAVMTTVAAPSGGYKEAPQLASLVQAGKLPPVESRLPPNPVTVKPLDSVGKYGGTIRKVYTGVNDWWNLALFGVRAEPLLAPDLEGNIVPNLLESYEYLSGGNVLRLHVRKGIKWSDGVPFTVDDIIYDLQTRGNKNMPLESAGLVDKVVADKIVKIDDYTADFPLKERYPLEFTIAYDPTVSPRHYLIKFDPRYDSTKTWQDLATAWSPSRNSAALVNLPVLSAWRVAEYVENVRIVAERNPYYWKVDTNGQQLPYIDRVVFTYVASTDTIPAMVRAGQLDFQARHLSLADFPFYKQNEAMGGYRTVVLPNTNLGPAIHLNYADKDPDLRRLFRTKEFRIALSYGIDRQAISNTLFFGQAKPWGFSPLEGSPANPGNPYSTMYTQYDPAAAAKLLDELGLKDTNGDGFRELGGKPFSIIIDMDKGGGAGPVQVVELIASQWQKIGIRAIANTIDRSLILARWQENSHDAFAWNVNGGIDPLQFTFAWSTTAAPDFMWGNVGVPLNEWQASGGKSGVEPPAFVKDMNKLVLEAQQELNADKRNGLVRQLTKMASENLYKIPTTTLVSVGIVSTKLANVPNTWTDGISVLSPRNTQPWLFYYK
jgi:peptide/nickel transport system substrate-binding protein